METPHEHPHSLPPVNIADHVFVQNQQDRISTKKEKNEIVTEVKGNDKNLVKVFGISRLTLLNRKFLRFYAPYGHF